MGFLAVFKVRGSGLTNKTTVDVLEALAFFLNEKTGACFPSTESIAKVARVHPNVARKTLKELEDSGLITSNQKPGCKRHFALHLERLPLQEITGGDGSTGVKDVEPLKEDEGVKDVEAHPLKIVNHPPLTCLSTPLKEVKPELEIELEINKEEVTRDIGAAAPSDLPTTSGQEIEEKKPAKEKRPSRWILVDRPKGVSPEAWKAYCQIRAIKRVPLTEKAWEGIEREAKKAGISLSEAIDICVRQGWAGFKSSWLENAGRCQGASKPTDPQYGIGVCQPPKEPTRLLTPEEVEESRRQMLEEGLIF